MRSISDRILLFVDRNSVQVVRAWVDALDFPWQATLSIDCADAACHSAWQCNEQNEQNSIAVETKLLPFNSLCFWALMMANKHESERNICQFLYCAYWMNIVISRLSVPHFACFRQLSGNISALQTHTQTLMNAAMLVLSLLCYRTMRHVAAIAGE